MAKMSKAAANTPYRFVSFIRDSSRAQALDIICFTLTLVAACVDAKSRRDFRGCLQLQDGLFRRAAPLNGGRGFFFRGPIFHPSVVRFPENGARPRIYALRPLWPHA